ncbi:MAG TPA: hypothetical protein VFZ95_13135 [Steroidobacteraceae bacterium]
MRAVCVLVLLQLLSPGAASAAELPEAFQPCVSLRRDAERLACFDRAAALIQAGRTDASGTSPEALFGTNADVAQPSSPENSDTKRDELKQISASVASTRRTGDGMIVVTLDNGQVWRQQDANVTLTIDAGDAVTVMRASMGTFRITDKRGRSARFKRLQ